MISITNKKMSDIYKFSKETHTHTLNGKNLTGCTTVLNVIAKPFLIPWAANMTAGFLKGKLDDIKKLDQNGWETLLDEARKAHTKKKEKAGDYGTKTHKTISELVASVILVDGYISKETTSEEKSIQNFIDWAVKNKVKFLASEINVWSKKYFLGGICDIVCELGGKRWVADIKTSKSGIYPENFWQCAGYDLMLQEQGDPPADGYLILNLKENGEFGEERSVSNSDNIKAFKACLDIYRLKAKINNKLK